MLIFSPSQSPRLNYVAALIGRELFDSPLPVTTDPDIFSGYEGPRLQYGGSRLPATPFYVPAVQLLFETGIRPSSVVVSAEGPVPVFFRGEGDLPFDLFAGIFFLLSRYEEWLPYTPDDYGRFPPQASLAFKNGFLDRPLIDEWLGFFKSALLKKFPGLTFRRRAFRLLPTYDIDMAWSYKGKGFARNTGGLVKDLLKGHFAVAGQRMAVLSGRRADPFDCFEWLDKLHSGLDLRPFYFFLLAARPGGLDKNISPSAPDMRQLLKRLTGRYDTGIHPSWQSGEDPSLLKTEIASLADVSPVPVLNSRQHYLRLSMPVTYRLLLESGIRRDFSMGYGAVNGFRASFTGDFFWYDLEKEQETPLLLTPFCFMDATAFNAAAGDPGPALETMKQLLKKITAVDGQMVMIWHNHYLGRSAEASGWRQVYETLLALAVKQQLAAGSCPSV